MGLFGELEGQVIVGSITSLGRDILRSIGMVVRWESQYVLTPHPSRLSPVLGEDSRDSLDDATRSDKSPP